MKTEQFKTLVRPILKEWWASLLMLPFISYSIHQMYWALNFNIFFAVSYNWPFPLNIVYLFADNFLLIVHEAGHTFFGIFGVRFITILGGSLFQLLLPMAIVIFCWINKKMRSMQFSLCLLGLSWMDVAGYTADGGARQLPLIGGLSKESHDWYNLLLSMNALEHDITLALMFISIGIGCYLWALLYPLFHKKYRNVSIDLSLDI